MAQAVHHINSLAELQALFSSAMYVAVDFSAEWCQPCKMIGPIFQKQAAQHGRPGFLAFAKVDVDRAKEVAEKYRVSAMPTFMFFKEGKQVAVNGQAMIRGADPKSLAAAAEKLAALATQKAGEAGKA
ncbi:Thioredoxin-like protein [Metarhizium album ARSEF 1941]|uniref:Thioredoxin-like protein n=1 Tax=Metarhizium album (strain ARSEF 1941) TaxID=1081103 RepID=A0A0B2WJT5_METAS|nr:Thioredoxin-like protein [Metarhizium album ARSEF 1941]KHN93969.1 Thioredoxin-like protein [Metarhizium album ARSEF 1941]